MRSASSVALGQRLGGADHVVVGGEQFVQGGAGLVEEGAARREVGLLAQQGDAGAGVQAHLAVVGPVEAGQDAQQRRLADAVGADQADALAGEARSRRSRTAAPRRSRATGGSNLAAACVRSVSISRPIRLATLR